MDTEHLQHFLDFVYELPLAKDNFCNNTLSLINKYFNEPRLIFCPYSTKHSAHGRTAYSGIVGKNIDLKAVKIFLTDSYKYDIFSASNIPRNLHKKTVLTIEDIMSLEEYEESLYGMYMQSIGLYYQACIYLTDSTRKIASISVFHTKEEGGFSSDDLRLFEMIGYHVSRSYVPIYNPRENYRFFFRRFFNSLGIGAALLDSNMLVVDSNREFRDYSELIVTHGNIKLDYILNNDTLVAEQNRFAQNLVSHLGSNILNKPERIQIECFQYRFQVFSKPLFSTSPSGEVENMHLMLLMRRTKVTSRKTLKSIDELTSRELDILHLLLNGKENTDIAENLDITSYTVKTHLQNIYRKFDVASKTELLIKMFNEQNDRESWDD